jgi:hypothetical protein
MFLPSLAIPRMDLATEACIVMPNNSLSRLARQVFDFLCDTRLGLARRLSSMPLRRHHI